MSEPNNQPNAADIATIKQTGKSVAKDAGMNNVRAYFESQKGMLADVLPRHLTPERMLRIALGALRTTPKLMQCTTQTLFGGVVQLAQLGLEPNTPLGHAYLIPFENRQKGITEVQVLIGYKGLIELARRSGQVISIAAHEVCEKDYFVYEYGLDEKLAHRPAMGDRGPVVSFYAVALLKDGGHAFEVMSRKQVEAIRDEAQNYKFARDKAASVWGKHFVEMGRKTVLRRLFKYLPVSVEMAAALAIDDKADTAAAVADLDHIIEGEFAVVPDEDAAVYAGQEQAPPAVENKPSPTVDMSDLKQGEPVAAQPHRDPTTRRRALD
ncbi:recombinase RecT [Ralstonia sp. 25C]|uniref:recombinase RecT n=1 Tax=Ralstonia sp. 25C TaxID=3447363 RepID=UPI003F74E161